MYQPNLAPANRSQTLGAVTASTTGLTVTGNASANLKGSWTDIGGATAFTYEAFSLTMYAANTTDYVVDVGISDGANRATIVSNLRLSGLRLAEAGWAHYFIPVHVPAGSQLSIRCAGATVSPSLRAVLTGYATGIGGSPGFSRAVALYTPGTSRGISVTPGSGVESSWFEISSSCPEDIAAVFGFIGYGNDIARATANLMKVDLGLGAAASEQTIYADFCMCYGSQRDGPNIVWPIFACDIPKTTRIAARAQANLGTDIVFDLGLWGLVR